MTSRKTRFSILIVGGAGAFGARVGALLAPEDGFDIVLSGRTADTLLAEAARLGASAGRPMRTAVLDAERASADDLARIGADLVINASGPFQGSDYRLAQAAIGAQCHYIDLADARSFVAGFRQLDDDARAAGVLAVSGASSVPGLSSAVIGHYREAFAAIDTIDIAISPGNAFDPGVATVASVLGGVGQPIRMLNGGAWQTVYGWQGLRRVGFEKAGRRWLGYVDVPDLDLVPAQVGGVRTVRFQAGLEVGLFHLGLWGASFLVRSGLVPSLAPLAPRLLAIKRRLHRLGSDRGGMMVHIHGTGLDGGRKAIRWLLVAGSGHGPYVPALASVALAKRIASGTETRRGALPDYGVVPLADILAEAQGLDITCTTNEIPSRDAAGGGSA